MYGQFLSDADDVLRARHALLSTDRGTQRKLLFLIVVFGAWYGALMGTFGGLTFDNWGSGREWQMLYSAIKVPLLLLSTFIICLPSFFVLNTLLGVRSDFAESVRAIIATQAAIAIVLASCSPLTIFWYLSDGDYSRAVGCNVVFFAVASIAGQTVLRRFYAGLIQRNPKHQRLLYAWIATYAFVGIQMGWILRPFIGSEDVAVQFLRPNAWDNAYLQVLGLLWSILLG